MSFRVILAKILDPLILAYELIISNRRLIFPTMIGLIIALTVISQTAVMVDSYRSEIFEEMIFSNEYQYEGDITANLYPQEYGYNILELERAEIPDLISNFTFISQIFNQTISLHGYEDYIEEERWYGNQEVSLWSEVYGEWEPNDIRIFFIHPLIQG